MTAEHRKPMLAFIVVVALAALILGNGLRAETYRVLIAVGTPPRVAEAMAPSFELGDVLSSRPTPAKPAIAAAPLSQQASLSTGVVVASPVAAHALASGTRHAHKSKSRVHKHPGARSGHTKPPTKPPTKKPTPAAPPTSTTVPPHPNVVPIFASIASTSVRAHDDGQQNGQQNGQQEGQHHVWQPGRHHEGRHGDHGSASRGHHGGGSVLSALQTRSLVLSAGHSSAHGHRGDHSSHAQVWQHSAGHGQRGQGHEGHEGHRGDHGHGGGCGHGHHH